MWKPRRQQFNNKSSVQRKKEHSASTVNTRSTATKMPPTNNMMEAVVPPPGSASTEESYLSSAHGVMQESLARAETRAANFLRISVIVVLLLVGAGVSTGAYWYTHDQEVKNFHQRFHDDAHQVIESFHELVERNIGSSARMSAAITSSAQKANQSFPFVTIPDFELHGSHLRVQSGSHIVHYMPLVTEENRLEWEEYALKNRYQTDESFSNDMTYRSKQDSAFGFVPAPSNAATKVANSQNKNGEGHLRRLISEAAAPEPQSTLNMTILGDGTGYHPRIWRNPSVPNPGDEPDGEGPYIPAWQRSPVDGSKQAFLNLNWAKTNVFPPGAVMDMIRDKKAIISHVAIPAPGFKEKLEANLRLSQYRERIDDFIDGLSTFLLYPVFDSLDEQKRELAGILATNIYWKNLFSNLLPSGNEGIICVVENSLNQTFSYRIDGSESFFIGMGDHHDSYYDGMEIVADVNENLKWKSGPENRAYGTVPLSSDINYRIRAFPSKQLEQHFLTNEPIIYTMVVISGFAFASFLFLLFSYVVEKRQKLMIEKVLENAHKAAVTERELNEFLSHEVRNPLSAAISACSFVSTAVNEAEPMVDEETKRFVREDIEVVNSSLHFINDFLRSMLDVHRDKQITVQLAPVDLLRDILEPVSTILYKRVASFEVIVDCPENLLVMADSMRLKQVVLNLVRNSSKFVEKGFLRMRATVVNDKAKLYVEDSGPGISDEKKKELFTKYQQSLDLLSQGTGIGLHLSKKLMKTLNGDLYLDDSYLSGIEGYPGACFVVDLNVAPLDIESAIFTPSSTHCNNQPPKASDNFPDVESGLFRVTKVDSCMDGICEIPKCSSASKKLLTPASPELTCQLPSDLSILFVDDDVVLRKLFVRGIKKVDPSWKIQEASSGETALRLCEVEMFDLIFMDQYMASVDKQLLGTETVQAMRTKGVESKICGLSANDVRETFINSGANEFLLKPLPCKPVELEKTLLRILEREDTA